MKKKKNSFLNNLSRLSRKSLSFYLSTVCKYCEPVGSDVLMEGMGPCRSTPNMYEYVTCTNM